MWVLFGWGAGECDVVGGAAVVADEVDSDGFARDNSGGVVRDGEGGEWASGDFGSYGLGSEGEGVCLCIEFTCDGLEQHFSQRRHALQKVGVGNYHYSALGIVGNGYGVG